MGWWRRNIMERKERAVPLQHEIKLDEMDARLSHMEDQVRRLRGYVYAKKGLVGPAGEPPPPEKDEFVGPKEQRRAGSHHETRDELRARLVREGRMVPGKPPNHGS